MKLLAAITFSSIYAMSIRLMFGFFNDLMGVMSITFLMIVPSIIGLVTVLLVPLDKVTNRIKAFFIPWITAIVILLATLLLNIEGAICWAMVFPLFAVLAGFGGIVAYEIKKRRNKESKELDNKITNSLNVSLAFLVPVVLGLLEGERSLVPEVISVKQEVVITAQKAEVWKEVLHVKEKGSELKASFSSDVFGFPRHINTSVDYVGVGGKRVTNYEHGLYFEEIIKEFKVEEKLVLEINTDPAKIPATVMDEHILIGGKYFDILEDTYELTNLPSGEVNLSLSSKFYVNTPFNWYSNIWAKYLLSDVLDHELEKIKRRVLDAKS